jgi:chromosome segregation ATPase
VLEDDLALKMTLIDEMNVSLTEKLAQIADISEQLANSTAEKREYVNKISVLTDEVVAKQVTIDALNAEIKGLNSTCMKMATANVSLDENFTLLQAEWDVLKTTVQDIESKNKENDTEIEKLTLSLKNANTSNVALQLQVEEVRAANGKFIQMSKKSKKTISELQVALKTMTKCFNDERSNSDKLRQEMNLFKNRSLSSSHSTEKLLREMSEQKRTIDNLNKSLDEAMAEVSNKEKMLDEKTAEIQAYVGDATKTIDNLAKSLDEATAEMSIKDKLLEEKTNEIQNRFDLTAQFNAADCGVGGVGGGMGNFWQTMYGSN